MPKPRQRTKKRAQRSDKASKLTTKRKPRKQTAKRVRENPEDHPDPENKGRRRQADEDRKPATDLCNALRTKAAQERNKGAKKLYCKRPAGWGTDHPGFGRCKLHGGNLPNVIKANEREHIESKIEERYGYPRDIEPTEALLEELRRTAGAIQWCEQRLALVDDSMLPHSGELAQYQDERAHFVRVAKVCVDAGIEERKIQLAEKQGILIATALTRVLKDLGVNTDAPNTRSIVRKHLTELSSTTDPVPGPAIQGDKIDPAAIQDIEGNAKPK